MNLKPLLTAFVFLCATVSYAQFGRLRAHVNYTTSTTPPYPTFVTDSSIYLYPGHRTLAADGITWLYDSSLTYNATLAPFGVNGRSARTYSGNNILTDSSFINDTAIHSWILNSVFNYTYDAHSNKTSITTASTRTVNFYNASNLLVADTVYSWNASSHAWVGTTIDSFTYDTRGNLTNDKQAAYWPSTSSWSDYQNLYYYYNAANKLDSTNTYYHLTSTWSIANRVRYIYDVHNNLVADSNLDYSSTGWTVDRLNFYSYNTVSDISTIIGYLYSAAAPYSKEQFTYDGHHNKLTDTFALYNSASSNYLNYQLNTYTYNSYNFVLVHYAYTWQGSLKWFGGMSEQNYYDPNLAVPSTPAPSANNMLLYPSPASTVMNIDMNFTAPQQGTIAIYDAGGRLHRQWHFNSTTNYHEGISVSELPAGNYVLVAFGSGTRLAQHFTVVH